MAEVSEAPQIQTVPDEVGDRIRNLMDRIGWSAARPSAPKTRSRKLSWSTFPPETIATTREPRGALTRSASRAAEHGRAAVAMGVAVGSQAAMGRCDRG